MTTTLTPADATQCSLCPAITRCVIVTIADEVGDMRRSALTLRTMTAAVCRRCIDLAMTPRSFARSRFDACPKGES